MNSQKKYIFYINPSGKTDFKFDLQEGYSLEIWKPSVFGLPPKLLSRLRFILWSVMYFLKFFESHDYTIFLVYFNDKIIHYTAVLPKYFKYPFMAKGDLQIGPTWTKEEHRRKGIASFIINKIIKIYKKPERRFWYITREENVPSMEFIKSLGFSICGEGFKKKRIGLDLLSYFYIADKK